MLTAYIKGKIRFDDAIEEDSVFRRGLKLTEDVLTSSVFERLLYLPESTFWSTLVEATGTRLEVMASLAHSGQVRRVHFWKNYPMPASSHDSYGMRQEPDLVVEFDNLTLIVEAKQEGARHDHVQWSKQILSVSAASNRPKPIVHLAIGGFGRVPSMADVENMEGLSREWLRKNAYQDGPVTYLACSWFNLTQVVTRASKTGGHVARVLCDIAAALSLYGNQPRQYLSTLPTASFGHQISEASTQALASWLRPRGIEVRQKEGN